LELTHNLNSLIVVERQVISILTLYVCQVQAV